MRISAESPLHGILSFAHPAGKRRIQPVVDCLFRGDLADVASAILRTYRKP
jgi:hypothetical protein